MGELTIDRGDEGQKPLQPRTNTPLVIALTCALLLLALFVAVIEAEGQIVQPKEVAFGSLNGHVVAEAPGQQVGGVRVLIRRIHAGSANFYFDRVTAADGSFELKYLLPGRYTIEVDRRTMPDALRSPAFGLVIVDVLPNSALHRELSLQQTSSSLQKPEKR